MTARRLVIEEKVRPYPLALVGPDHFRTSDAGPIPASTVIDDPAVSLYCVDPGRREAVFVRSTPGTDLSAAAFLFQAQYDAASELIAVPYATLPELARRAPEPERLVLIYSIGRCGSTLLARAFAAAGADVLSEPDVFTQLVSLRAAGADPAEVGRLAASCARLVFARPAAPAALRRRPLVVKFRSFVVELAQMLREPLPEARIVFLYRHAATWAASSLRAFGSYDPSMAQSLAPVQDRLSRLIPLLAQRRAALGRLLTPVEALACQWVSQLARAEALGRDGAPMHALRYEELTARPREELASVFAHCQLPPAPAEVLNRVLARDSQAGTTLAREALDHTGNGGADPEQLIELARVIDELSGWSPDHRIHNGGSR